MQAGSWEGFKRGETLFEFSPSGLEKCAASQQVRLDVVDLDEAELFDRVVSAFYRDPDAVDVAGRPPSARTSPHLELDTHAVDPQSHGLTPGFLDASSFVLVGGVTW